MCAHPALCRIMTGYFPTSTNARGRPRIPAFRNSGECVQGSSTATRSHEGEEGAWRLYDSRRPDFSRQDSLTRGSGRPIAPTHRMNVRPWFGSASWLAPISSKAEVTPIGRIAGRRRLDYPGSFADAQMDGMTASGAKLPFTGMSAPGGGTEVGSRDLQVR
jgi:hypothetical protein